MTTSSSRRPPARPRRSCRPSRGRGSKTAGSPSSSPARSGPSQLVDAAGEHRARHRGRSAAAATTAARRRPCSRRRRRTHVRADPRAARRGGEVVRRGQRVPPALSRAAPTRSASTSRNAAPGTWPARYSSRPRCGLPSSQRQSTNDVPQAGARRARGSARLPALPRRASSTRTSASCRRPRSRRCARTRPHARRRSPPRSGSPRRRRPRPAPRARSPGR